MASAGRDLREGTDKREPRWSNSRENGAALFKWERARRRLAETVPVSGQPVGPMKNGVLHC